MRHINQSMFWFTLKTDKGIRFFECFTTDEAIKMAEQDDLKVIEVLCVDTEQPDIIDFIVYGHKQ